MHLSSGLATWTLLHGQVDPTARGQVDPYCMGRCQDVVHWVERSASTANHPVMSVSVQQPENLTGKWSLIVRLPRQ